MNSLEARDPVGRRAEKESSRGDTRLDSAVVEETRRSSNPGATPKRLVRAVRQVRSSVASRSRLPQSVDERGRIAVYRTRRELTVGVVDEIVERFVNGEAMRDIAANLKVDRRRVRKALYERGAATPPTRLSDAEIAQAARLYQDGASLAAVGDRFGVTANTIKRRFIERGVDIRPGVGGPARRCPATTADGQ